MATELQLPAGRIYPAPPLVTAPHLCRRFQLGEEQIEDARGAMPFASKRLRVRETLT